MFLEATDMVSGSRSEVYQALWFGWGLLAMSMGGLLKLGKP